MSTLTDTKKPNKFFLLLIGLIIILLVGLIDYLTGTELEFRVLPTHVLLTDLRVLWIHRSVLSAMCTTVDILSGSAHCDVHFYWCPVVVIFIL
jgi:hypothetical protein